MDSCMEIRATEYALRSCAQASQASPGNNPPGSPISHCLCWSPPTCWMTEKIICRKFLQHQNRSSAASVHAGIWVSKGSNLKKKYRLPGWVTNTLCPRWELIQVSVWHWIISNNLICKQPPPAGPYSAPKAGWAHGLLARSSEANVIALQSCPLPTQSRGSRGALMYVSYLRPAGHWVWKAKTCGKYLSKFQSLPPGLCGHWDLKSKALLGITFQDQDQSNLQQLQYPLKL